MRTLSWSAAFMLPFLLITSKVISEAAVLNKGTLTDTEGRTRAILFEDEGEAALACVKEHDWRGRMLSVVKCKDIASLYNLGAQETEGEGQPVVVQVMEVNGGLTLPPNTNLSLVGLSLHQTNLTHFTNHTQDLSKLEELIVSGNPDFDASSLLQLGTLPSLVTLQLAGTALATLSSWKLRQLLKEMPALQYLDVSFSNLHHLEVNTFQHNKKLQKLNIAGNELNNLTLDQGLIEQLKYLNISGCSLKQLHVQRRSGEAVQTNLYIADVSHNYLTSLQASFMNIISNSGAYLNVSDNLWNESCALCSHYHLWNYVDKHPEHVTGAPDLNCFRRVEALKTCGWEECPATCTCDPKSKTVNCSSADLKTVPLLAPSDAEILLLKNNDLLNMSGIESPVWCKLRTVNADHNSISSIIPPGTVGHCTCFDHDDLYEEEESCLPQSLHTLSLSHNKIKNFFHNDCQLLYSLQKLHLSGNKVEHLGSHVCSSLERLEVLFLDNNRYSDLEERDVAPYPNLRELNLSFNKLVTLPYRIIELMPKLTALDVSHNKLNEFSGKTSTPDTPFTSMVPTSLKQLNLSNNNLEMINSVLSLKYIPILKKLSISNNPWECSCEIIFDLLGRVWNDWKNTAMVNAVENLECQNPSSLRGLLMNDTKVIQICSRTESQMGSFQIMVGILLIVCLIGLVVHVTYQKITPNIYEVLGWPPPINDATYSRRYSVFIVHSEKDNEMVRTDLVDPLESLDYSVAWYQNAFLLGDITEASIENTVKNSRRMLVVASKNLLTYPDAKQIIERGLTEERKVPGFKVAALVTDDLPANLYDPLREIVVKRTHVSRQNSNYLRRIRDVLPASVSSRRIISFTETNLYHILWQEIEKMQRRNRRTPVQEVFPPQSCDHRSSSVGTSNITQRENRLAGSSISNSTWTAVLSRFHQRRVVVLESEQPHPVASTICTLQENTGGGEVPQIEGFSREKVTRHTTRF